MRLLLLLLLLPELLLLLELQLVLLQGSRGGEKPGREAVRLPLHHLHSRGGRERHALQLGVRPLLLTGLGGRHQELL